MKRITIMAVSLISAGLIAGAFAFGHSTSADDGRGFGYHHGAMGKMMNKGGMGYSQQMFDVKELTAELELNDEQITLLSQIQSGHLAMQELMRAEATKNDGELSHRGMMSVMSENFELMETHHNLFDQFEASLNAEQKAKWSSAQGYCH